MVKNVMTFFTLALMALMFVGCCDASQPMNVTVSLDDAMRQSLQSRKIEVHLIALNSKEDERWENYSMTKYWQPGDTMRGSVPTYRMIFDPTNTTPQTLSAKDPIWAKWLANGQNDKNMKLYVLALLPGMREDMPGDKDSRRQILPLNCKRWSSNPPNVLLKIQENGIITMTPPKPASD